MTKSLLAAAGALNNAITELGKHDPLTIATLMPALLDLQNAASRERADSWALLRAPFAPEQIGELPRVWCTACRNSRTKNCSEHQKRTCTACHNNITTAHKDLPYVGHAAVTDRLLSVDPSWYWSPMAVDEEGLPKYDRHGGLWITLHLPELNGAFRHGYGSAGDKTGPDAIKEVIGDAIRNAAMRFGVALDLWHKGDMHADPTPEPPAATPARPRRGKADAPTNWLELAAGASSEDELTQVARACNEAGAYVGEVKSAFFARRGELLAGRGEEERALKVVRDQLGATATA